MLVGRSMHGICLGVKLTSVDCVCRVQVYVWKVFGLVTRLNVVGALIHLEAAGPPTQREVACGRGPLGVRPILG